jgi:hypothetical protein
MKWSIDNDSWRNYGGNAFYYYYVELGGGPENWLHLLQADEALTQLLVTRNGATFLCHLQHVPDLIKDLVIDANIGIYQMVRLDKPVSQADLNQHPHYRP